MTANPRPAKVSARADDALLRAFAEDAFDVLNWARRVGMKRDQQLDEVVKALRKRLAETNP